MYNFIISESKIKTNCRVQVTQNEETLMPCGSHKCHESIDQSLLGEQKHNIFS